MPKLKIEDLAKISEEVKRTTLLRVGQSRARVNVHMGTCGISAGSRNIVDALLKIMDEMSVKDVILTTSGCAGLCSREPMATVELPEQPPVKYIDLTPEKIRKIFLDHVMGGKIVTEYALALGSEREHI
jgi:NADP-reducing hydrogenase subunit HndB